MVCGGVGGHGRVFQEVEILIERVWRVDREYESVEGVEGGGAFGS